MKLLEKDVMAYIPPVMSSYNVLYSRFHTGAAKIQDRWQAFGHKGWADYIGCMPGGKFLAVETKSTDGKLTKDQEIFRQQVLDHNGIYIVCRCLDDLLDGLKQK